MAFLQNNYKTVSCERTRYTFDLHHTLVFMLRRFVRHSCLPRAYFLTAVLVSTGLLSACDSSQTHETTQETSEPAANTAISPTITPSPTVTAPHPTPRLTLLPESTIAFTAQPLDVAMEGRFADFSAIVDLDPTQTDSDALQHAKIQMVVDTRSITVGMHDADEELQTGNAWFGATALNAAATLGGISPKAVFESSLITSPSPNQFEITGTLTIKGTTQPLTTLATVEPIADADGSTQWRVQGGFPIQRLDYNIGTAPWNDTSIVADTVEVRYALLFSQTP